MVLVNSKITSLEPAFLFTSHSVFPSVLNFLRERSPFCSLDFLLPIFFLNLLPVGQSPNQFVLLKLHLNKGFFTMLILLTLTPAQRLPTSYFTLPLKSPVFSPWVLLLFSTSTPPHTSGPLPVPGLPRRTAQVLLMPLPNFLCRPQLGLRKKSINVNLFSLPRWVFPINHP